MLEILSADLRARAAELGRRFCGARPFPHLIVEEFFDPRFCEQLIAEFPPFERSQSLDPQGQPSEKGVVEDLRSLGGAFARADDLFRSAAFLELLGSITGIPGLLYDPDYAGGGTHENQSGADLDPHVDFNYHPTRGWHRRLNLIVYLNREWREEWGGTLELHTDPWLPPSENRIERVLPVANRAVLFETSERSWHGVQPVAAPAGTSRKSLALYLYTTDRPGAEVAPSHGTVFVDRPLEVAEGQRVSAGEAHQIALMLEKRLQRLEQLSAGEFARIRRSARRISALFGSGTLEREPAELLRRLFAFEDRLLHTLYDREKQLSEILSQMERLSPERFRLPIFGPVELLRPPTGFYPHDRWCGAALEVELRARAPLGGLTLHGYVPEALGARQTLTLSFGGEVERRSFGDGMFHWTVPFGVGDGTPATLRIEASASFSPAETLPGSEDRRRLAFMLHAIEVA